MARKHELSDAIVEQVPTRRYPKDDLAAHLRLRRRDHRPAAGAAGVHGADVGRGGGAGGRRRATYNKLMGRDGSLHVEVQHTEIILPRRTC